MRPAAVKLIAPSQIASAWWEAGIEVVVRMISAVIIEVEKRRFKGIGLLRVVDLNVRSGLSLMPITSADAPNKVSVSPGLRNPNGGA
jgi:hypothetical protein